MRTLRIRFSRPCFKSYFCFRFSTPCMRNKSCRHIIFITLCSEKVISCQLKSRTSLEMDTLVFEKFQMPFFFSRCSNFLSMSDWNWSETSPVFFFSKYLNKYSCQRLSKFRQKWAIAGWLIEYWAKFLCQFRQICDKQTLKNFRTIF